MKIHLSPRLLGVVSAFCMVVAWWLPAWPNSAGITALLGWLFALALTSSISRSSSPYRTMYLVGLILNAGGFYWLFFTIKDFGGFWNIPAFLILALFVTVSSLQLVVFVFFYKNLPQSLDDWSIRTALAWVLSELISIRIFPWQAGHTQLGFKYLAQVADIGGTLLISFILLSSAEALWRNLDYRVRRLRSCFPLLILAFACLYGQVTISNYQTSKVPQQDVAVIQANISLEQKHNIKFFAANAERYVKLTASIARADLLVIWPESVIQEWIAANVASVRNDPRLPRFKEAPSLLIGTLTHQGPENLYNSAMAIFPDGSIPEPYHKRILMPFGEYTPFGETFPWIKEINATAANFSAGKEAQVFSYSAGPQGQIRASPLICYEDVVPALGREATKAGANLLVNITNDAWFGDSVAPYQHHLIASFRAIENRRYMIRSTNSGFTAIINELGMTVASLTPFREGILQRPVLLFETSTLYTRYLGEKPWWFLLIVSLIMIAYRKVTIFYAN